jgi:integrase/recombinase XerD
MTTLIPAINDFLSHCRIEKNLNSKTIKAYQTDLEQLIKFLKNKGYSEELAMITKIELRAFIDSLGVHKPKTIKRKIASARALFNYFEFEDIILANPFRKMRISIKEPRQLPSVMNITEVSNIYNAVYKEKEKLKDIESYAYAEALRNVTVIELLFTTGARVSEIANLTSNAINLESGTINIQGKGDKERIIQVCNKESISMLQQYFDLHKPSIEKEGYFLINRLQKKLSDQSIRNMVKATAKTAGITRRITPHVFRHSFATLLLERDVDIKYIQAMLGHSSISTTQIYTHVNKEKQREILNTKHPRLDIAIL